MGTIVSLPNSSTSSGLVVGQRVVGEINARCHKCSFCARGGVAERNHCATRSVLGIANRNGCFAEYITLPPENLHPVPDDVDDVCATFAEPLAAAYRLVEQHLVTPDDNVAVIGDGKLGLLCALVVQSLPCKHVTIFGHHAEKLAHLPDDIEKHTFPQQEAQNVAQQFADHFDVTIEASGTCDGIAFAASITRPLGTIALKSTCAVGASSFNTAPIVIKEINVVGSRCGNLKTALQALSEKRVKPEHFLAAEYLLENALDALAHAEEHNILKVHLVMS